VPLTRDYIAEREETLRMAEDAELRRRA
jgi:hypothetical protein